MWKYDFRLEKNQVINNEQGTTFLQLMLLLALFGAIGLALYQALIYLRVLPDTAATIGVLVGICPLLIGILGPLVDPIMNKFKKSKS